MGAILTRAGSGVPGDITRQTYCVVDDRAYDAAKMPAAFGAPVKLVAGKITKIEASDLASVFYGFLVRMVPSIAGDTAQTLGGGTPNPLSLANTLLRGFINVLCLVGTPVANGLVYMRVVVDGTKLVGDLEATSDVAATAGAMVGTGNATAGTLSATQDAQAGVYRALFTAATAFNLIDPKGDIKKVGATGAAYTADGVTLTITVGATPAVAGDYIDVTVVKKNVPLVGVVWNVDGKDADNVTEVRVG